MEQLDIRFRKLWNDLGLYGEPTGPLDWLRKKYGSQDRHYHTLDHIGYGLDMMDKIIEPVEKQIAEETGYNNKSFDIVRFAFYFHDSMPDEQRSSDAASLILTLGRKPELIVLVDHFIRLITHKSKPGGYLEKVMVDSDLAILGSDEETFDRYESNVRKEYSKFTDLDYSTARRNVLEMFLDRESIYYTLYGQRELEEKARANLERSCKKLQTVIDWHK